MSIKQNIGEFYSFGYKSDVFPTFSKRTLIGLFVFNIKKSTKVSLKILVNGGQKQTDHLSLTNVINTLANRITNLAIHTWGIY